MYLVTNSQMKAIEQKAIVSGMPSLLLMENAAMSLTELIVEDNYKNVLLFCGKGNNGGDGLACARQLYAKGIDVNIIFIGMPQSTTEDCCTNLNAVNALNIPIVYFDRDIQDLSDLKEHLEKCDLIVDAMVGTGLESKLREPISTLVNIINNSGKPVYSVDCPTGVSTDSGDDFGLAVYAKKTVTFHLPKVGLMLHPACEHTGELIVGNISLKQDNKTNYRLLSNTEAKELMPKRIPRSDKSCYGRIYAFTGCDNMTGAAVLSAKSAYKVGAGLIYAYTTRHCSQIMQYHLPEAVVNSVPETDGYINSDAGNIDLSGATVILIGCGLGNNNITYGFLKEILNKISIPLVLDADGLNIISQNEELKNMLPNNTVITPHPKEMSRLTGLSVKEIINNPVETALSFAKKYNVITVLKDARTVIASPQGQVTINITGTPAMSKGGSGDCLAGIISGLIAQGLDCCTAASLGCYISGKAGEIAESRLSSYGITASDLIDCIPAVFD